MVVGHDRDRAVTDRKKLQNGSTVTANVLAATITPLRGPSGASGAWLPDWPPWALSPWEPTGFYPVDSHGPVKILDLAVDCIG